MTKSVLVKFDWSALMSKSPHFEQSFSNDGGKNWESQLDLGPDPRQTEVTGNVLLARYCLAASSAVRGFSRWAQASPAILDRGGRS